MFSKAEGNALEIKAFTLSGGFPRFRFWVAGVLKAFSSVGMWVCRADFSTGCAKSRPRRTTTIGRFLPLVTGSNRPKADIHCLEISGFTTYKAAPSSTWRDSAII